MLGRTAKKSFSSTTPLFRINKRFLKLFPLAPQTYPFIGTIPFVTDPYHVHSFIYDCAQEIGKNFRLKLGTSDVLVVGDNQLANYLLITNSQNYGERKEFPIFNCLARDLIGSPGATGIVFANGPTHWGIPRKATQETLLQTSYLRGAETVVKKLALKMINLWEKERKTQNEEKNLEGKDNTFVMNASDWLHRITLDIIGELGFGKNMNSLEGTQAIINTYIKQMFAGANELYPAPFPYWDYLPSPTYQKTKEGLGDFIKYVGPIINERRKLLKNKSEENNSNEGVEGETDEKTTLFLDLLLQAQQNEGSFSDAEVAWNTVVMLTAGHDTTASTLAWTTYFLSKHPEIQERVYQEIETVLGDRVPTHSDLSKLEYLTACIKETLRLCPIGPVLRLTKENDTWGKYTITKGTWIWIDASLLGRTAEYWPDPDGEHPNLGVHQFKPDRFYKHGRGGTGAPGAWIPFGLGIRSCVGQRLAMMEAKIILATLLQKYSFHRDKSWLEPARISEFTLKPDKPVLVRVTPRK